MDHGLRHLRRWLEAERSERSDDADAACRMVFEAAGRAGPAPGFADRVLRSAPRRAPAAGGRSRPARARVAVALAVAGCVAAAVAMTIVAAPIVARQAVGLVAWSAQALVWMLFAMEEGLDIGAVLLRGGEAVRTAMATREATLTLVGVQAMAVLALFALHRLLVSEKEST